MEPRPLARSDTLFVNGTSSARHVGSARHFCEFLFIFVLGFMQAFLLLALGGPSSTSLLTPNLCSREHKTVNFNLRRLL